MASGGAPGKLSGAPKSSSARRRPSNVPRARTDPPGCCASSNDDRRPGQRPPEPGRERPPWPAPSAGGSQGCARTEASSHPTTRVGGLGGIGVEGRAAGKRMVRRGERARELRHPVAGRGAAFCRTHPCHIEETGAALSDVYQTSAKHRKAPRYRAPTSPALPPRSSLRSCPLPGRPWTPPGQMERSTPSSRYHPAHIPLLSLWHDLCRNERLSRTKETTFLPRAVVRRRSALSRVMSRGCEGGPNNNTIYTIYTIYIVRIRVRGGVPNPPYSSYTYYVYIMPRVMWFLWFGRYGASKSMISFRNTSGFPYHAAVTNGTKRPGQRSLACS